MKRIDSLIGSSARHAMRDDRKIREAISRTVPKEWLDSLGFCRLDSGQLHLTVRSAALVTKLRFQQSAILRALRAAGLQATAIRWHVMVADPAPAERYSQREMPTISERTAAHLRSAADAIDDDTLKRSLLDIAERSDK